MPAQSLPRTARPARMWHILRALAAHHAARRSRLALLNLDDHLLRDIGLTADQARREATRWDAPMHWRG